MQVQSIYRYPVKGLNGQSLSEVKLTEAEMLPGDRRYALGLSKYADYSDADYAWAKKAHFVCAMRQAKAATWSGAVDGSAVTASHADGRVLDLKTEAGRATLAADLAMDETPSLVDAQSKPIGHGFTDMKFPLVSFGNIESARYTAERLGMTEHPDMGIDPARFKINVWLKGLRPWQEFEWLDGQQIVQIGDTRIKMFMPVGRCMNINADPKTGQRSPDVLAGLTDIATELGHYDLGQAKPFPIMGVFGIVVQGGVVKV